MLLVELVEQFVTGNVDSGAVSSVSVRGNILYSYAYPLAYRGRDNNGNTTIFVNYAPMGATLDTIGARNFSTRYDGSISDLSAKARKRDAAFSVTTSRQRRAVERAASDAYLNVIECRFDHNGIPVDDNGDTIARTLRAA